MPNLLQAPAQTQTANPLAQGTLKMVPKGTMGSLLSMGQKAAVPGGISSPNTNTIPPKNTAAPSQQQATGNGQTPNYAPGGHAIIPPNPTTIPQPTAQPITGNTTTPSGAVVNATTGQTVSTPTSTAPTFPGAVGQLLSSAQQNPAIGQQAANIAANYGKQIADVGNQGALAQEGLMTTGGPSAPLVGNALAQAQLAASREQALGTAEDAALKGTGQQLTAQSQEQQGQYQAAGLSQPTVAAYGQTAFNPLTDQYTGGGAGVSPSDPFYATMQTYAQLAAQGQTSAIPSSISGNAVLNAQVQNMARQINPNYNPTLAAASAQTQAQGQQLQTQTMTANAALDTLGQSFSALSGLQTGGIPLTNSIAQWIGQQMGDSALSKYKSNLADARAQLVGVLNASGGTPTGNEATAMQYLPDDMTPAMFQQNVGTSQNPGIVRQLMQQKVQQFTTSGTQAGAGASAPSPQSSGGIYDF
jgi:hypothetical protein